MMRLLVDSLQKGENDNIVDMGKIVVSDEIRRTTNNDDRFRASGSLQLINHIRKDFHIGGIADTCMLSKHRELRHISNMIDQ
jgi:hypothetical protein